MNLGRPKNNKTVMEKNCNLVIKQFQELGLITDYWEINFAKGQLKVFFASNKIPTFPF